MRFGLDMFHFLAELDVLGFFHFFHCLFVALEEALYDILLVGLGGGLLAYCVGSQGGVL